MKKTNPTSHYLAGGRARRTSCKENRDAMCGVVAALIEAARFMQDPKNADRVAEAAPPTGHSKDDLEGGAQAVPRHRLLGRPRTTAWTARSSRRMIAVAGSKAGGITGRQGAGQVRSAGRPDASGRDAKQAGEVRTRWRPSLAADDGRVAPRTHAGRQDASGHACAALALGMRRSAEPRSPAMALWEIVGRNTSAGASWCRCRRPWCGSGELAGDGPARRAVPRFGRAVRHRLRASRCRRRHAARPAARARAGAARRARALHHDRSTPRRWWR